MLHVRRNACRRCSGGSARNSTRGSEDALQDVRVDDVHHEHGLEEGVGELRMSGEQCPCLIG